MPKNRGGGSLQAFLQILPDTVVYQVKSRTFDFIKEAKLPEVDPVISTLFTCPRRESNPDLRFRKPPFYPLNYGDV
jgi:hypothetical protein